MDFAFGKFRHLFYFTFFEVHVFANNWVVFLFDHFFGHGAGVLFCDIKIARICRAVQADFNGCWLRHGSGPLC